jgi:hypothetical protein
VDRARQGQAFPRAVLIGEVLALAYSLREVFHSSFNHSPPLADVRSVPLLRTKDHSCALVRQRRQPLRFLLSQHARKASRSISLTLSSPVPSTICDAANRTSPPMATCRSRAEAGCRVESPRSRSRWIASTTPVAVHEPAAGGRAAAGASRRRARTRRIDWADLAAGASGSCFRLQPLQARSTRHGRRPHSQMPASPPGIPDGFAPFRESLHV